MPPPAVPRVFISYAWESDDFKTKVKSLAVRLRNDGIDARLDVWHNDGLPIPDFMDREMEKADFVLVVCSPAYKEKVRRMRDGEKISGVGWEQSLLTSAIWGGTRDRTETVMVLMGGSWRESVPNFLSALPYTDLSDPASFDDRYGEVLRRLTGSGERAPELGGASKSQRQTYTGKLSVSSSMLVGREQEIQFLDQVWKEDTGCNIVQIIAPGGTGKTALLNKWRQKHVDEATLFGWSFYTQGSAEMQETSSDPFFAEALKFFKVPVDPTTSALGKANALAQRFRGERVLLLLDGLEPLQDSDGEVKDDALRALLLELATKNAGLAVITTRVRISFLPDDPPALQSLELDNLTTEASVEYLRKLGVKGEPEELREAAEEYGNHALALTLLGRSIVDFCGADVRRRNEIPVAGVMDAGDKPAQQALRMIKAYEILLAGQPELEVLRALGYFDRPAEPAALKLLLPGMNPRKLQSALNRLRKLRLVSTKKSGEHECHPLIREYFGAQAQPDGHAKLYAHYSAMPPEQPDTEARMAPVLHAIRHGCRANRHEEAFNIAYRRRILRGDAYYLTASLGLFSTNLAILATFFNSPWMEPAPSLSGKDQALVTSEAAYTLLALGRINEAAEPMRSAAQAGLAQQDWAAAAVRFGHLSRLLYLLGQVGESVTAAKLAVDLADKCDDWSLQVRRRSVLAVAHHLDGDRAAAGKLFAEAEALQKQNEPNKPFLYETPGYRYCDLLLAEGKVEEVRERVRCTLALAEKEKLQLNIGLDQVMLARCGDRGVLETAVANLKLAGRLDYLPHGLLARGLQEDLYQVRDIANRSGMKLYLADFHLAQARLDMREGRKDEARENLDRAAQLVAEIGYRRRDPEVAELQAAIT